MNEPTRIDRINKRIRNNPVMAVLIVIGTIIIAFATFTNAAKDLLGLVSTNNRANINGEWTAEVPYYWNNKTYNEEFTFTGEGKEVSGNASLFRKKKNITEGSIRKNKIDFIVKVQEQADNSTQPQEAIYRYTGTINNEQITFVLQKEGDKHQPIEFTAYRITSRSFD